MDWIIPTLFRAIIWFVITLCLYLGIPIFIFMFLFKLINLIDYSWFIIVSPLLAHGFGWVMFALLFKYDF